MHIDVCEFSFIFIIYSMIYDYWLKDLLLYIFIINIRKPSFRSIEVIHRYFEENQMRKFIPPEFTLGKDHPEHIIWRAC